LAPTVFVPNVLALAVLVPDSLSKAAHRNTAHYFSALC
jgi:hypothetical protein